MNSPGRSEQTHSCSIVVMYSELKEWTVRATFVHNEIAHSFSLMQVTGITAIDIAYISEALNSIKFCCCFELVIVKGGDIGSLQFPVPTSRNCFTKCAILAAQKK